MWFKKKTRVKEKIEETQRDLIDRFNETDPASDEAGKMADNFKKFSEAKNSEEKSEFGSKEWLKAILVASIPAVIMGAFGALNEMQREKARAKEIETLLDWEDHGEINNIPTSPTTKRYLNSGPKY